MITHTHPGRFRQKRSARELIFGWSQSFSADLSAGANFSQIPIYNSAQNLEENLTEWWLKEDTAEDTLLGLFSDRSYVDAISTGTETILSFILFFSPQKEREGKHTGQHRLHMH